MIRRRAPSAAVPAISGDRRRATVRASVLGVALAGCAAAPPRRTAAPEPSRDASCARLESRLAALELRFEALDSQRRVAAVATPAVEDALEVERVGELRYRLQRRSFDALLAEPDELLRGARIVPASDGGQVTGFRLFGVRPGGVFDRLGFRNGDEVRSVNGMSVAGPDDALRAYSEVRAAPVLTVELMRAGRRLELRIEPVD